jgi:hypothetical protein
VLGWGWEDAEVGTTGGGGGIGRAVHPTGLAYRLGERGEIVRRGLRFGELTVVTYDVPPARGGQP